MIGYLFSNFSNGPPGLYLTGLKPRISTLLVPWTVAVFLGSLGRWVFTTGPWMRTIQQACTPLMVQEPVPIWPWKPQTVATQKRFPTAQMQRMRQFLYNRWIHSTKGNCRTRAYVMALTDSGWCCYNAECPVMVLNHNDSLSLQQMVLLRLY